MPETTTTHAFAEPFTLPNGTVLANRLVKAALSEQLATLDNAPTARLDTLYRQWSEGGFGLVLTGNVMVDRRALGEPRNVVVEDDRDLEALSSWASAARSAGNAAWVQINHPGRQTPRILTTRPVAPSAVALKLSGQFARPRTLTGVEIEEIIERFAVTAETVVRAGFDGVQVHSAHGYLASQFLSPITNQRTDAWGGTPEKRMRFLLEVVRAVRARVGASAGVGVKLNSADFQRGGFSEEESMGVVDALSAEGIDLLEISGGTYERAAMVGVLPEMRESTRQREAYFLEYAERVRSRASMPLLLTGGLRTATAMDSALRGGAIDLIGLGRPACLEPGIAGALVTGAATAAPQVQHKRIGFAPLDALTDQTWHTIQLWRLSGGKTSVPGRHPVRTLPHYLAGMATGGVGRRLRRPPQY